MFKTITERYFVFYEHHTNQTNTTSHNRVWVLRVMSENVLVTHDVNLTANIQRYTSYVCLIYVLYTSYVLLMHVLCTSQSY